MAEASVAFLLENVKELLIYYIKLTSDSENELRLLKQELELMKAFLEDSAQRYEINKDKSKLFKKLEGQIKEVVYEVEDVIDKCVTQAAISNNKSRFNLTTKRISLAKEIKILREDRVKPVFEKARMDFATLVIPSSPSALTGSHNRDLSRKTPLLRQDNVVGFEDEADTLIEYLKEESEELEVISIIGMPGLGKTTLAWKISHDPRIQHEFPTIIWVYVSQEFNRRELFLNIIKKFTQQDMSGRTDLELAQKARSYLSIGKFLLFMDDVWTVEAWDDILSILPKSNEFGKVLITSRHRMVACHANPKRDPHELRFLTSKESWELLQYEVFGKLDECPEDLDSLGREIAQKCDGLPLSIVIIGGTLLEKYSTLKGGGGGGDAATKNEWQKVADSVTSYLNFDKEERMKSIISLSYNKLPYDVIDCFLYLGMFPEDYEIPAWKLTRLWIAEGFIQHKSGRTLEEIAEGNLKEFINRNLVMVEKMRPDGGVKTCRVHDMIREFCKKEAALGAQNLYQEIRWFNGVFDPQISDIHKYRRLCIHSYVTQFLSKKPNAPYVRSFVCFCKEAVNLSLESVPTIPDAFNLLRVLDVAPIKFPKFPTKITQLLQLRYIALCGDDFKVLPEAISKLWNLQTITVETLSRTLEIKADIGIMTQLRHFKTKASIILSKKGKTEGGENLQTLGRLSPECCTDEVFDRTPNLKILGIRGKLAILLDSRSLAKLSRLEKLKLVNDVFPAVASENPLTRLPQPDRFPPNLRNLTLSATFLNWRYMSSVLGNLDTLEVLKLKENAFIGTCCDVVGDVFCSLEFLQIERTDLAIWKVSDGSFPRLRCLVLKKCERLEGVPFGLVKSLHKLEIERVTKTAVDSARKIEEEKKQRQGTQAAKRGGFKLIIAPGDDK